MGALTPFPRPKGRGLIEAVNLTRARALLEGFRGRKAAASLKRPRSAPTGSARTRRFRGRKAAASLKPGRGGGTAGAGRPRFRGRKAAASLKPLRRWVVFHG